MIFNLQAGEVKTLPILSDKNPEDITVKQGENAIFSAVIEKDGIPTEYTYLWYVNDSLVSGATTAVYTRKTDSDIGVYTVYCEITNKAGVVKTRTATLTVNTLPKLDSTKPADATVNVGASKTFEVAISEHGYPRTYTYQWYKNGSVISGATSSSYTYTPSAGSADTLYCMVSNSAGSVKSRTATITAKQYLYTWGHDITDITGGWGVKISKYDGITFTLKKDNSFMSITRGRASEGMVCTNAIIDLSKYKLLYCRAMRTCGGDFRFGVMPTNDKMNNYSAVVDVPISNDFSWLIVDISSINSGYIGFDTGMQTNNPGYMQAVEIYLV